MKTIIVKANNQVGTVAEHTVVTQNNMPTEIKATDKTNYELFDTAAGRAPNNIVTKRMDKDLYVSFENNSQNPDLIIEGFYDDIDSALIGIADNGSYYYYVPDTGEVTDYVTELQVGEVQGQSLGGDGYASPWWIGATGAEGLGALPWLVGLAGVGLAVAALGEGNDNDTPPADTTAPDAPTDIYVGNDDAFINAAEIDENGNVDVIIGLPDNASAGDIITVNGVKQELNNDDIESGNVTVKIEAPPEGETLVVTASITDAAGNESDELSETVGIVDTIAPGKQDDADQVAPVVGIEEAADGVNATEFSNGVQTQVTLPTGTVAGDTVTLTVTLPDSRTITVDYKLTPADIASNDTNGFAVVTIPNNATTGITADGNYSVTATVTDEAGNISATSVAVSFTVDTIAPGQQNDADQVAPTVALSDDEAGGVSALELDNGVQTQVTLPTGTVAGDTVTLTVTLPDSRTITVDYKLTPADIASNDTNGFAVVTIPNSEENGITADGNYSVTAVVTDVAGNVSATSESVNFTVDTIAPGAPNIAIGNGDASITVDEIVNDQVSVTVVLPNNAVVGDTVTVNSINKVLDSNNIIDDGNGRRTITFNFDAPLEGLTFEATATITDAAGNTSSPVTTATATRDTANAPVAPVSVDIGDGSPFITGNEIANNQIIVTVELPDSALAGYTVIVNGTEKILNNSNIIEDGNGKRTVTFNFDAPLEGLPFAAIATIKNTEGALSTAVSASAIRDTIAPDAPIVTIGDGDDTVNGFDLATEDQVTVTVDLQAGTSVGDLISINGGAGVEVTLDMLANGYVTTVPLPTEGEVLTVTATVTDRAGNSSGPGEATATVGDIDAPVIIARDDIDNLELELQVATTVPVDAANYTLLEVVGGNDGTESNLSFSVGDSKNGTVNIEVKQTALVAVADAISIEVYNKDTNELVYVGSTDDSPLIGDVAGLEILGLTGNDTLTATVSGLEPGNYTVVVRKSDSALTNIVKDVELADLGDSGIVLGAENQGIVLDAIQDSLGFLGATLFATTIRPAVTTLLSVTGGGVDELIDILERLVPIRQIDNVLDAVAKTLLSNTLTLLETTDVKATLTEYSFADDTEITGNVIDPDQGLSGELGEDVVTPNTKVTEVNGVSADVNTGIITVNGQYGVLEIDADGDYTYTANGDYSSSGQSDTFTYTIYDSVTGDSDTAELVVDLAYTVDMAGGDDVVNITNNVLQSPLNGLDDNANTINIDSALNVNIIGGEGFDTINLTGSGQTLSLSDIFQTEVLDISGTGANTLTVQAADVTNSGTTNPIYVRGGSDDTVNLEGGSWSNVGQVASEGEAYTVWQAGNDISTQIYVDTDISVI